MSDARKLSYVMAFNEAVRQSMEADPDVFCAGEDIGAFGGVFGSFGGLQSQFGEKRVVDTPISEQAIIGLLGYGPVNHDIKKKLTVPCGKIWTGRIVCGHYQNPPLSKLPLANSLTLNCLLTC